MKTSLIVTTYNSALMLRKVGESLLLQSRMPDEVVIADDGSDHETAEVVGECSRVFPFPVVHVWQEKRGFRAAKIRNEAIKKSSGEYIVLLDGDCVVNRHFISDHLSLAEEGCFVQGKRVHVSRGAVAEFGGEHANSMVKLLGLALTGKISNSHHVLRLPPPLAIRNRKLKGIKSCNMSFFRRDVLSVNGFNEDFVGWGNEDSELACRFFKYGLFKKVHSFMAICFHFWHPTNKTADGRNERLLSAALESKEYFCKNGIVKER